MPARSRAWSSRARRDFDEREDYRKRRGEEDRYERKDSDDTERGRRDERQNNESPGGWYDDIERQFREGDENTDYDGLYKQLRERFEWYEEELDRYDADYDELIGEVDRLRNDNRRYMMRGTARRDPGKDTAIEEQDEDIKEDGKELSFDDLWKKADEDRR